jgi:Matrixin
VTEGSQANARSQARGVAHDRLASNGWSLRPLTGRGRHGFIYSVNGPDHEPDDVFFDESFVRAATATEMSADERARQAERSSRAALLQSRLENETREIAMQAKALRRRRWRRRTVGLVAVGGLAATGLALHKVNGGKADSAAARRFTFGADRPSPSREAKSDPIGQPAAVPSDSTRFSFLALQSDKGSPVAYDPCRPIHYVTNGRTMPPNGEEMVTDAIAAISAATGLVFINDGETDEEPVKNRESFQRSRYGDRWVPVLIAWSDPSQSPDLNKSVIGQGGSMYLDIHDAAPFDPRTKVYITGTLALDGPAFAKLQPDGDVKAEDVGRAIVLHELGHLVGLGHVEDPTQVMYPSTSYKVTSLAPGDLNGLAKLGRGDCFPTL